MGITFFVFVAGLIYGFVNSGKEDKLNLLKKSIAAGIAITLIFTVLFFIFTAPAWIFAPFIPIFGGVIGAFAGVFVGLYFGIAFVVGAFVGDLIESAIRR